MDYEDRNMIREKLGRINDSLNWIQLLLVILIFVVACSCSSYEVVKKTQTKHMRYEPTKERHGGGKTTLE